MMKGWRSFLPAGLFFLFINLIVYVLNAKFISWNIDTTVLLWGNFLLFIVCLISFLMSVKGLQSKNNYVFFRWIYGSFILKLFLLAGIALVYILVVKENVNKPALIICMVLYLAYTGLDLSALMKVIKQKKVVN